MTHLYKHFKDIHKQTYKKKNPEKGGERKWKKRRSQKTVVEKE